MEAKEAKRIVKEFNEYHYGYQGGDCLFVSELRQGGLTDGDIAHVIETMGSVCNECWNAPAGCKCWNDE